LDQCESRRKVRFCFSQLLVAGSCAQLRTWFCRR